MNTKIQIKPAFILVVIVLAAFSRILPHPSNFSPLAAISLVGGLFFSQKYWAIIIPILSVWISDLFINNVIYSQYYPDFTWFYEGFYWQYGSYILIGLMGLFFKQNLSFFKLFGMTLSGSILFFIISNFGCFMSTEVYTKDLSGLMFCYAAGIPFFSATVLGDVFYTFSLSLIIVYAGKRISFLRNVNG
jgi:hypothetical protein